MNTQFNIGDEVYYHINIWDNNSPIRTGKVCDFLTLNPKLIVVKLHDGFYSEDKAEYITLVLAHRDYLHPNNQIFPLTSPNPDGTIKV